MGKKAKSTVTKITKFPTAAAANRAVSVSVAAEPAKAVPSKRSARISVTVHEVHRARLIGLTKATGMTQGQVLEVMLARTMPSDIKPSLAVAGWMQWARRAIGLSQARR